MKPNTVILVSILCIVMGTVFTAIALYLGKPESVKKAPIAKKSSTIFHIIGAVTIAFGITGLVLGKQVPKTIVQGAALAYLVILTTLFIIYSIIIRGKNK